MRLLIHIIALLFAHHYTGKLKCIVSCRDICVILMTLLHRLIPVLPKTVNCAASDLQVEVCWEPYSPTCPVSQYNLEWEGDVLWDEDLVGTLFSFLFQPIKIRNSICCIFASVTSLLVSGSLATLMAIFYRCRFK